MLPSVSLSVFLLFVQSFYFIGCFDFCLPRAKEEKLCKGERHIVCDSGSVPMGATYKATAPMTYKVMKSLLKIMNKIRDEVASGAIDGMPKAARLRELIWSEELEFIATHHVKHCTTIQSVCPVSPSFPVTGELIGLYASPEKERMQKAFDEIFGEMYLKGQDVIEPIQYTKAYSSDLENEAADFALIINEYSSKVGCAVALCADCEDELKVVQNHCYFVTCYFNNDNIIGCPIYTPSEAEAANECEKYDSKRSEEYKHLCANNGKEYKNTCVPIDDVEPSGESGGGGGASGSAPSSGGGGAGGSAPSSGGSGAGGSAPSSGGSGNSENIPKIEDDKYGCCAPGVEEKLCYMTKKRHFICDLKDFPRKGTLEKVYEMTQTIKNWIVDHHNKCRNDIAGGKVESKKAKKTGKNPEDYTYPSAARMREYEWSDELAYTAEKHARLCCFEHDKCRHTKTFRQTGQNVGNFHHETNNKLYAMTLIENSCKMFYAEKEVIANPKQRMILHDGTQAVKENSGHFTQMMLDEGQRVGCAMTMCSNCKGRRNQKQNFCYIFTCHYDVGNANGYGLYKPGDPVSKCDEYKVGKSSKYPNLCASGPIIEYTLWKQWNLKGFLRSSTWPKIK